MAEFQAVMKQTKRMCAAYESRCDRCPFGKSDGCPFDFFKHHTKSFDFYEVEHIVMDWADKHPEPKYPTWEQWWENTFPEASEAFPPCKGYFMRVGDRRSECRIPCEVCKQQPIPADIAEKLGIKPVGGSDNG